MVVQIKRLLLGNDKLYTYISLAGYVISLMNLILFMARNIVQRRSVSVNNRYNKILICNRTLNQLCGNGGNTNGSFFV